MKVDFLPTLVSVAMMVALCVPGFILRKLKFLKGAAVAPLVVVLLYVSQPALTVSSFLSKDFEPKLLIGMVAALILSVVLHIVVFFAGRLFLAGVRNKRERDVLEISSFLGNVGYMGIPIMKAIFPSSPEMLLYTAVFIVGFNIVGWTLGIYNITHNRKDMSLRRAFLNPPVAALIIALPLFFTKAYIPTPVLDGITPFIDALADITLPLSMIILGIRLAEMPVKSLFCRPGVYISTFVKLIFSPLLCFCVLCLVAKLPFIDPMLVITGFIIMAMPSASLTLSLCEMFNGDRESAVRVNVLSTLLCVITIPLFMLLCQFIV